MQDSNKIQIIDNKALISGIIAYNSFFKREPSLVYILKLEIKTAQENEYFNGAQLQLHFELPQKSWRALQAISIEYPLPLYLPNYKDGVELDAPAATFGSLGLNNNYQKIKAKSIHFQKVNGTGGELMLDFFFVDDVVFDLYSISTNFSWQGITVRGDRSVSYHPSLEEAEELGKSFLNRSDYTIEETANGWDFLPAGPVE